MTEINSFPINTLTYEELDPITDAQATDSDGVLFFDESVGVMKRMTRGELFKGKVIPINSIADFPNLLVDTYDDRQQFHLNSFAPDGSSGGGPLMWAPDKPKSLHDGIRYFSPTVPIPADFNNVTDVQNYMDGVGEEFPTADGIFELTLYSIQSSEFPSIDGAFAIWDGPSGNQLKNGVVPSLIGIQALQIPNISEVSYARFNADETISMRTLVEHKTDLQLNNVDNTSDADKPISTDTQTALNLKANSADVADALALKAPLASPALTGTPTAPTAAANTNTEQLATTAFVQGELTDRVQSVETIADLRGIEPSYDGQQMMLLGHTVKGFGGGIVYHDASSTAADDNGMTVVTSGGARWLRKTNGLFVSIECYGAVPGQSAEITGMVQSAIDWAHSSITVKKVVIPAGSWNMDTVYLRRGITLQGAGKHVTRLYQSKLPTVEGMIRADRSHDASNSRVYDLSVYGNGMVPSSTNLLKGVLFEEVVGFECGRCHAENLSSYGFWAHTHHNTASQYMCKDGLFYDLSTNNVEHAFETKRAEDITWRNCVAVGNAQYSESAFHPWERSKRISYLKCKAFGDFKGAALNIIGSSDPGNEGNNSEIYFDVDVHLNKTPTSTPNRCARIYRADDVTIKGRLSGFLGVLWGGGSGDLTLDCELDVVIAGLQSPSNEIVTGGLYGDVAIRLSAPIGVGQLTEPGFIVQQNGSKHVSMGRLDVTYVADSATNAVRLTGISATFDSVRIAGGQTSLGVYNSVLTADSISAANRLGVAAAIYTEDSSVTAQIRSVGFTALSIFNSDVKLLDGSDLFGRATVTMTGAAPVLSGVANITSDAENTGTSAWAASVNETGSLKLSNSKISQINAGSLGVSNRLIASVDGAKIQLNFVDISTNQPSSQIPLHTAGTLLSNCSVMGTQLALQATANNSMLIGNIVDIATANTSTGSIVTEVVA